MHRERKDVGAIRERALDPVAVVRVDVDVRDAETGVLGERSFDRDRHVVVDAEAGRVVGVRVMQPTSGRERPVVASGEHLIDGEAGRPDREGGSGVHTEERRGVTRADPRAGHVAGIRRGRLDERQILGGVEAQQVLV